MKKKPTKLKANQGIGPGPMKMDFNLDSLANQAKEVRERVGETILKKK